MSSLLEYCRLYVGQPLSLPQLVKDLLACDYRRVDQVLDPGDFSLRGGVLDVFPATFESPLRLEFISSRIGSMRSFNPKTLETLDQHTMVVLLPRKVHTKLSVDVPFESFVDVREGDYVVHLDHGIGRYVERAAIPGGRAPSERGIPRPPRWQPLHRAPTGAPRGERAGRAQDVLVLE